MKTKLRNYQPKSRIGRVRKDDGAASPSQNPNNDKMNVSIHLGIEDYKKVTMLAVASQMSVAAVMRKFICTNIDDLLLEAGVIYSTPNRK